MFGAVSLTKNADIDKYKYSGYGIGFDRHGFFSHPSGGTGRNVIIFGVDMSSSTKIDNRKKDILILGKGPIQGLEHTLTAEKMYSINFTVTNRKFCLSLHYNGANSYLFVNGTEIYKFKAKDSEIVATPLCLGNISEDWTVDDMKKTGLNGYVCDFSVDYDAIAVDNILDIHKIRHTYIFKIRHIISFLDISKAFDKIWHGGLIFKLKQNGISSELLHILSNFLSNRKQRVVLNGQSSPWTNVHAGLPQGSILGPLLFLIYI